MTATEEQIILLGFKPKQLACPCCGIHRVEIAILERMRCFFDFTEKLEFQITSCCRCWNHHVEIYQGIYGDDWEKFIPHQSKHLISDEYDNRLASCAMDITGQLLHLRATDLALKDTWHGGYHFYMRGKNSSIHLDTARKRRWR